MASVVVVVSVGDQMRALPPGPVEVLVPDEVVGPGECFVGETPATRFRCLGDENVRRREYDPMRGRFVDFMDPDEFDRLFPLEMPPFEMPPLTDWQRDFMRQKIEPCFR